MRVYLWVGVGAYISVCLAFDSMYSCYMLSYPIHWCNVTSLCLCSVGLWLCCAIWLCVCAPMCDTMGIRVSDTIPGIILVDWYSIWFIRAAFIPMLDRTPTRHVSAERYTYHIIIHKKDTNYEFRSSVLRLSFFFCYTHRFGYFTSKRYRKRISLSGYNEPNGCTFSELKTSEPN